MVGLKPYVTGHDEGTWEETGKRRCAVDLAEQLVLQTVQDAGIQPGNNTKNLPVLEHAGQPSKDLKM